MFIFSMIACFSEIIVKYDNCLDPVSPYFDYLYKEFYCM